MLTSCEGCGHRLWAEVRAAGAFRFIAHFDDDKRSATYTEHAPGCPGCGTRLDLGLTETDGDIEAPARLIAYRSRREGPEAEGRRPETRAGSVGTLLAALTAHDGLTGEHSGAVAGHAVAVARRMGLTEGGVAEVEQVALLHDLGKIGVDEEILNNPRPLDDTEWRIMKTHPAAGGEMVASTKGLSHLAPAVRASHERWDGKGYPDGLSGEEIPIASRIVLACDAFHAMTSDRPYREALDVEVALEKLEKNAGAQFCPRTIEAFVATVGQGSG